MQTIYRGPFGPLGGGQGTDRPGAEVPPRREDEFPRSLPEDRSEGNLNPDPTVECHGQHCPTPHHPSGEPDDDDGAGNPLPREVDESHYGLEDADEMEWALRKRKDGPDE